MANTQATVSAPAQTAEAQIAELQKQLAAAQAEAVAAKEAAAAAEAAAAKIKAAAETGALPIEGEYKGYGFQDGHKNVRDREGKLCDTTLLLQQAAAGDATATAIMDWLIWIDYGYLRKV